MHRIVFNCNQTKQQGFGHFFRCLNFARHLKRENKFLISFTGRFSPFSSSTLKEENFRILPLKCDKDLFDLVSNFDFIVTDRYDINQDHLDKLSCNKLIKSIVLDDFYKLDFSNHDLIVNFRVGINYQYCRVKNKALGENFFIYKPELDKIRSNYQFRPVVNKLLFFGTGTNKSNSKFNELPAFLISEFPQLKIIHITNQPLDISSEQYIPKAYTNSIETFFQGIDAIINGGGLIKYESAFCGIPSATLSITRDQNEDTEILADKGLLFNLGNQEIENKKVIQERLFHFIKDVNLRKTIHEKGRLLFTPKSINNLIEKIYEL